MQAGLLREELDGVEETHREVEAVIEHIGRLEEILKGVKKPVRSHILLTNSAY
jgi:hypothetical protein